MALSTSTLHLWITFIFTLTMISGSNSNGWTVDVNRHIDALRGSDVLIQCRFTHPSDGTNDVNVFWKKDVNKDKGYKRDRNNPFIFHHDSSKIIQSYRGRTSLVGNVHEGNCSLTITNIVHDESNLYVRVHAGDYYSFYKYPVSIKVTGTPRKAVTIPPALEISEKVIRTSPHVTSSTTFSHLLESLHLAPTQSPAFTLYLVISVPIASVFIVGIVLLIVFLICRRHGRSRSLNRIPSVYYANVGRRTENQTKSDLSKSFPQDPGLKAIDDEPVYSNVQLFQLTTASEMDESIYANV